MRPDVRPVMLVILDGWGLSPEVNGNAVALAHTPTFDHLLASVPHARLRTSGRDVGLPDGQMGNSEVGHLNLGAGFVVDQDLTRLGKSIEDSTFFDNAVLGAAMDHAKSRGSALHLVGLVGEGGVHAHSRHLLALVEVAARRGLDKVFIQAITDGRDTPPTSGLDYVRDVQSAMDTRGLGRIASVSGRYWAMDRDKRWPRTARAWAAMTGNLSHLSDAADTVGVPLEVELPAEGTIVAHHEESGDMTGVAIARTAEEAIMAGYTAGVTDEFLVPTVLVDPAGAPLGPIRDGDAVVLFNFRADRMRQLLAVLTDPDFAGFPRRPPQDVAVVTMTEYVRGQPAPVAFPSLDVVWPIARVISEAGLRQYHTAETEKYAHVTYFFNGGREAPFPGEERVLTPSPKVATYDLEPQMSAAALTDALVDRILSRQDDFIVINYANPDMVGHTGILEAAIAAVETVDGCLGRALAALEAVGGAALVTADHGNCEMMIDPLTGGPHTAHTTNPVPLFLVGEGFDPTAYALTDGRLADVAPTLLALMSLTPPETMTGHSLLVEVV